MGSLEETLSKLLVPDNNTIQQATQQLKETFKDPNIVPGLCQVLGSSQSPETCMKLAGMVSCDGIQQQVKVKVMFKIRVMVRQYAAILLRRKVQKGRQWRALPPEVCQNIRDNILQILLAEPDKTPRNAIAEVIAMVARHDIPNNQWPELFTFIQTYTKSQNPAEREVGMGLLHSISSAAGEQLKPHLASLLQLLAEVIQDNENRMVPYYAIRTVTELIFFIGDDEVKYIQGVVPRVLHVIKEFIPVDESQACSIMEVFDEMLECEVSIIAPHIKTVVEFSLEVARNSDLGDNVRVKAMSFITSLIKLKKKAFLKHKLVDTVLHVLFPIICDSDDLEEEEEDALEENECERPAQYAPQVIDTMALHLPPDKLIPNVMKLIEPHMNSEKASHRRASYICLAVVAEGCADYITNRHLQAVLHCVVTGLNDPDHTVRNAALFALGQFSEHLQPDISKFASELLPLIFNYLNRAAHEADKNPRGLTKSYYALEMFCENLEKDIMPYLPKIMEHMLTILRSAPSARSKELAISAIGATASAAKEGLRPYFGEIMEQFKLYLNPRSDNNTVSEEEMRKLQIQTLDTVGVLARSIGEETFAPIAKECAEFALNLLNTVDDPDLRRCVYSLFGALSTIMKQETSPYLETLVTHMMGSLKSTEGVKTYFKEEKERVTVFNEEDFCDEEDLTGEEEDDEEDTAIAGISVENAFVEEKEDTCCALGELAENSGAAFYPYLELSFSEVIDKVEYPNPGIKKAAMTAVGQMCICVHKANVETPSPQTQTALTNFISAVMVKLLQVMKEDNDRQVVMAAIDTTYEMLNKIGLPVIQVDGVKDAILTRMKEAFTHKLSCQDADSEEEDEEEAEFDGMLIESAGDVLPAMAKLMGGEAFLPFFTSFLVDLVKRLKVTSSVAEKSFAVGTIADIIKECGAVSLAFVNSLYPLFMKYIQDEDDEVRSNAVFGLGILVANSGNKMYGNYTEILKCLFGLLSKEKNGRVMDNVCAATCRMISTHQAGVPLEMAIPIVIQCLPLKEDYEENPTVYNCMIQLYSNGEQEVLKNMVKLLSSIASVLGTDQVQDDLQSTLIHFVKDVHQKFPSELETLKGSMSEELFSKLTACLTMTNGTS